jgi:uncharacterized protein with WD repeat
MKLNYSESYNMMFTECFDDTPIGDVMGLLMTEGLVDNESDARMMIKSMSREWFECLYVEAKENNVKKLKARGPRKGELWAGGGQGGGAGGGGKKKAGGNSFGMAQGGEGQNFAGKGRFANNNRYGGPGGDKRHKNNPSADDRRAKIQKDQAAKDRNASRGITPEERRERARQNKERKAKENIDSLLKDIRGK